MAVYKNRETGMIKVLVRDDGDRVYIADLGNEAGMYPMAADEFEDQYEEVEAASVNPATSGHSVGVLQGQANAEEAEAEMEDAAEAEEQEPEEPATGEGEGSGDPDATTPAGEVTINGDAGTLELTQPTDNGPDADGSESASTDEDHLG